MVPQAIALQCSLCHSAIALQYVQIVIGTQYCTAQRSGQARLSLPMAKSRWFQELPNKLQKVARIQEQGVKKNWVTIFFNSRAPKFNRINLNIQSAVPSSSCVWPPREGVTLPVLQPYLPGLDWRKWGLQTITATSASLHTSRCQLMEQFQFQEKWQLKYLLFIHKDYHNNVLIFTLLSLV